MELTKEMAELALKALRDRGYEKRVQAFRPGTFKLSEGYFIETFYRSELRLVPVEGHAPGIDGLQIASIDLEVIPERLYESFLDALDERLGVHRKSFSSYTSGFYW